MNANNKNAYSASMFRWWFKTEVWGCYASLSLLLWSDAKEPPFPSFQIQIHCGVSWGPQSNSQLFQRMWDCDREGYPIGDIGMEMTTDGDILNVSLKYHKSNALSQGGVEYLWAEGQTVLDYRACSSSPWARSAVWFCYWDARSQAHPFTCFLRLLPAYKDRLE